MALINLDAFANLFASYVRKRLANVHRAAILVRCTADGSMIAAVFGNDNFAANPAARREVGLVRRQLKESSLEELAFGLSHDGYAWALLVKAELQGFQTAVGKAFRSEMLRAALDEAVWTAWRTVSETSAGAGDPQASEASRLPIAFNLL